MSNQREKSLVELSTKAYSPKFKELLVRLLNESNDEVKKVHAAAAVQKEKAGVGAVKASDTDFQTGGDELLSTRLRKSDKGKERAISSSPLYEEEGEEDDPTDPKY